jgi:hypothetical protein
MQKLSLFASMAFPCALAAVAAAQGLPRMPAPTPHPMPPPALPLVPPPVDHPAYLGQPGLNKAEPAVPMPASPLPDGGPAGPGSDAPDPAEVRAREFLAKRIEGRDLKKSVDRVLKEVHWYEKLDEARAEAAAQGLPLLWIQALGEVDGFA